MVLTVLLLGSLLADNVQVHGTDGSLLVLPSSCPQFVWRCRRPYYP